MEAMTPSASNSVTDEIDDIRHNGDTRFSKKGKAAIETLLATDNLGDAIDALTEHDSDA